MVKKVFMVLAALAMFVPAAAMAVDLAIVTDGEIWTREVAPDTSYENNGLNVYNDNISASNAGQRETLIQFDLSGVDFTPGAYADICLELWSMSEWSSSGYPTLTEAAIFDTNGSGVTTTTWNSYYAGLDATETPLESMGAYDYDTITNEPGAYGTYLKSFGSAADLAAVLAETDGILTIIVRAVSTGPGGAEYRADWGDDIYGDGGGNRATLTLKMIPEPTSLVLIGIGMVGLLGVRRRK